MPIHFTCPSCERPFRVADKHAGAQTKCPGCGKGLTVPDASTPAEEAAAPMVTTEAVSAEGDVRSAAAETEESLASTGFDETSASTKFDDGPPHEGPILVARKGVTEDELDMTPMVDVTFLLLIFFMITAAFSLQKSIEIPRNEEEAVASRTQQDFEEDDDFVVVRITGDNVFWVSSPNSDQDEEAPSETDLLVQLREARAGSGGGRGATRLLVMASGDARHEYVVRALDAGTAVGMEEVKLATMDEDDE